MRHYADINQCLFSVCVDVLLHKGMCLCVDNGMCLGLLEQRGLSNAFGTDLDTRGCDL